MPQDTFDLRKDFNASANFSLDQHKRITDLTLQSIGSGAVSHIPDRAPVLSNLPPAGLVFACVFVGEDDAHLAALDPFSLCSLQCGDADHVVFQLQVGKLLIRTSNGLVSSASPAPFGWAGFGRLL